MGLQRLLNICNDFVSNLKLKFNPSKSVCMKFQKTIQNCFDYTVKIGGENIEFVKEVKYLGFLMNSQLNNKFDILRERNRFYNTFNTILRKFYFVNTNIFLFLFKTYCLQFYGASLWCGVSGSKTVLKQFSVGFHKAIKKILKVPWRASNHVVCQMVDLVTLPHIINMQKLKFVYRCFNSPSRFNFLSKNFVYLSFNSEFLREMDFIMTNEYNVILFLDNDLDAL